MNPIGGRSRLLASCAIAASLVAMGRAAPTYAQAFQGTHVTVSGSATVTSSPGVDRIDVGTPQAVIDWTPSDPTSPTIDFLPGGTQAQYVGAPSLPGFTVLNRILPASPSQIVAFNGSVITRLQDSIGNQTPGGAVWFYTPGGILVGATATFDVGGLLLTTADPIRDTFGNFLNFNTAQFRAATGSLSGITIAPGARIDALPEDSYLAIVAPRITQSGTATVNGGVAYVAAEAVDLTINRGTFEIAVVAGTTASGNALVHDGVTTGPSSSDVTDPHRIYMVAVPQNDAITLLVSGRAGFDPATVAGLENGAVVLSAGRSIAFDQSNGPPQGAAEADVRIIGGDFTSRVSADSSGSTKAGAEIGNLNFAADIVLSANRTAELRAVNGDISVGGSVTVRSAVGDRTAGTAAIIAEIGKTITITGDANAIADGGDDFRFNYLPGGIGTGGTAHITSAGNIQIGGAALVTAQGRALFSTLGNGFTAFGGDAAILTQSGGTIGIALGAQVRADAFAGGSDSGASGDALGGTVTVAANSGLIDIGGPATVTARAFSSSNITAGGSVTGGVATFAAASGGTVRVTGDIELSTDGIGASSPGIGGAGTGGTVEIRADSGGTLLGLSDLIAQASGFSGPGLTSGDAHGGFASVALNGGALDVSGVLDISARAGGLTNIDAGAHAFGGNVLLTAASTSLDVGGETRLDAGAGGGNGSVGGDGTGGTVTIVSNGALLDFGARLTVAAPGTGGSGNAGSGGTGIGGAISILSDGDGFVSGMIAGGQLDAFAYGLGGNANGSGADGGVGRGGSIAIAAAAGSIAFSDGFVDVGGFGGQGGASSAFGGAGGLGIGGDLTLDNAGGPFTFASLLAFADGRGGDGGAGDTGGGSGGNAQGGSVTALVRGGTMSLGNASMSARANGGFGGSSSSGPIGIDGSAVGGTVLAVVDAATALLAGNIVSFSADAHGHDASAGAAGIEARLGLVQINDATVGARALGTGGGLVTGGNASLFTIDGNIDIAQLNLDAGANASFTMATANGGDAQGGNVSIVTGNGSIALGDAFVGAYGQGGSGIISTAGDGGDGGEGRGGTIAIVINGGALDIGGNASIGADGIGGWGGASQAGGNGGLGGLGIGGSIAITGNSGAISLATVNGSANGGGGFGGDGDVGGAGGMGLGGLILIHADAAPIHVTDGFFSADGNGGAGAFARIGAGGAGGDGFGGSIDISGRAASGIDGTHISLFAHGFGGFGGLGGNGTTGGAGGAGGNAVGGLALLSGKAVFGFTQLAAAASGGGGGSGGMGADLGDSGGVGGAGGDAAAGTAEVRAFDGDMDLGRLSAVAFANGGQGGSGGSGAPDGFGMSISARGGDGGDGTGGVARLLVGTDPADPTPSTSGTFAALRADLDAGGVGGFGSNGDGGDGLGGTAAILVNAGTVSIGDIGFLGARGFGGSGLIGGDAFGGFATINLTGGTINFAATRFIEAEAIGGDGDVAGTAIAGTASIELSGGTINAAEDLVVRAYAQGGYSPNLAGQATGGAALVRATGGSLFARGLEVDATASGGGVPPASGTSGMTQPRPPSARGGDAFGGTAHVEAIGGSISASQQINLRSAAHGGSGTAIGGGNAFGGTSILLIGVGGTVDAATTHVSVFASGGGAFGPSGTGGQGVAGNASLSVAGGTGALGSVYVDAFGFGGQSDNGALAGDGTGGSASLSMTGGNLAAIGLQLTGSASGGNSMLGGNGGRAFGGSASASFTGGQFNSGDIGLVAHANGGLGGTGIPGIAGGNGGDAFGGQVLLAIGGDAQLNAGNSFLAAGAFGGIGGNGGDGAMGGNGGAAVGGTAILTSTGGFFAAGNAHGDAVARGGDGGLGGASGGAGGNGSSGIAGSVTVEAVGGALSFGSLDLIADGTGGNGGTGDSGAPSGSGAIASGGIITIRTADTVATGAAGTLVGGDTFMTANGFGGFGPSGPAPVDGVAGRLIIDAAGVAPGGMLGFNSLIGSARGVTAGTTPLFELRSASQVVAVNQTLDIGTDGDALVELGTGAQLHVPGSLFIDARGSILIDGPGPAPAIDGGSLFFSAGRDIMFTPTTLIHASSSLQASAIGSVAANQLVSDGFLGLDGGSVTVSSVSAGTDIDLHAINTLSAGTVAAGGDAFLASSNGRIAFADLSANTAFLDSAADTSFTRISTASDIGIAALGGSILGGNIDAGGHVILLAADRVDTGAVRAGGTLYVANASMIGPNGPSGTIADFLALPPVATGGSVRFGGTLDTNSLVLNAGGSISLSGLAAQTDIFLSIGTGDLAVGALATTGTIALNAAAGNLAAGSLKSGGDIRLTAAGAVTATGSIEVAGNFDVKGDSIAIDAIGPLRLHSAVATGSIQLSSTGLFQLDGHAAGANIAVSSADIDIGGAANIAAASSLSLSVTGGSPTTIGGTGSVSGYSLDAAEFGRLSAPSLTIAASADIDLFDLTVSGSSAAASGVARKLRIETAGAITVAGKLLLADAETADRLELSATRQIRVVAPTGGIALKAGDGTLAGTLSLASDNILVASDAAAADLAAATDLAERKERLAMNDGAPSSAGYLEAAAISLEAGRTLYVQNSGTPTELAGLTVSAGGLSVSATGSDRAEMILYGRGANADGSFVTGEDFVDTVDRSRDFTAGSTINGCFLFGPCLAPPEPVQQAIAATVDTVVAVIASAQESDSGASGGGGGGAPSSSQAVTRAPNIVLGELLDFTPFKMQGPIEGPVTGAGNDDAQSADFVPPAEPR